MVNDPTYIRPRPPAPQNGAWLHVVEIPILEPLDFDTHFDTGITFPPALDGILFDPDGGRATYAILDAATWPFLPEVLAQSKLKHRCLFKGDTALEAGDSAPWLVELKPDHAFTAKLMIADDPPIGLWGLDLGIYLKTAMSFDALWAHCRKFTRIQDDAQKWFFHRFWAPPVSTRAMALGNRPELVQLVAPFFPAEDRAIEVILLNSDLHAVLSRNPGTQPPATRPLLTKAAQGALRQIRRVQQYEGLIDVTLGVVTGMTDYTDDDIRAILRAKRDWFFQIGFWQKDHLAKLMVWEVLLGPDFVDTYAKGTPRAIIETAKAPFEAIMNIEFFLEAEEIRRVGTQEPQHP